MENAGTTGVIPNASNTKKPDRMSGFFIVQNFINQGDKNCLNDGFYST